MNQRTLGSILSYVQMLFGVIVTLLYTPYMICTLGQSEYGLYNTVVSTISMLGILSLGFNSSYIRYYAIYKKRNEAENIAKLNGMFISIFCIIGFIAFLSGVFISNNLVYVFADGLTADEYTLVKKLFLLLTFNLTISFPMSVFTDIISAHERFVFLKLLGLVKTVCSPLVTLPLLIMGYRSVGIVVVTVLFALFTDCVYLWYVVFKLKEKFTYRHYPKGLFKDLLIYTSFIAINIIVDQINWNVDKLILARYRGTVSVAIYSVAYILNNYYCMISTAVSSVFVPLIHKIINDTRSDLDIQRKELTTLFIKVGRIQFLILSLIVTGFIFFGKSFIEIWVGIGYEDSYYILLLLLLPVTIPLIENVGVEIQRAQNKHSFRSIIYLIMAVINVVMSIWLCKLWGAIGTALGTSISLILANGLIMNVYYHKQCNIDIIAFWKNILSIFPGFIIPVVVGVIGFKIIHIDSLLVLCGWAIVYTLIYCISIWQFSLNIPERAFCISIMDKLKK